MMLVKYVFILVLHTQVITKAARLPHWHAEKMLMIKTLL